MMRGLGPTVELGFVEVETLEADTEPSADEGGRVSEEVMRPAVLLERVVAEAEETLSLRYEG